MGSLILAVCAGLPGTVLGAAQTHETQRAKANLGIVRLKPFTVKGSGFKPRERVLLRLSGDATGTARGTANGRGLFTVKFSLALTSCSVYVVRATGAGGTRAALAPTLRPACMPVATADFGPQAIVRGSRFRPGERLTVTLIGDGTHTMKVTANRKGQMEVDFGALSLSNCSAYTLKITGSKGSAFTKKHPTVPC
jgi:hypothetical protein